MYDDDDSDEVEVIEDESSSAHRSMQVRYETIPIKPKSPCSAYVFFSIEFRRRNETIAAKDAMAAGGKAWQEMSEDERKPYREMEEKDRLRYSKELKELRETGSFTNQDGVNSRDITPKKRLV